MINVEIIKVHVDQILPCGRVTGKKEFTIDGLIGCVISRSAKLVRGNHYGDSFHIFNTSTLPVVATRDVLTSLLSRCLRVICA